MILCGNKQLYFIFKLGFNCSDTEVHHSSRENEREWCGFQWSVMAAAEGKKDRNLQKEDGAVMARTREQFHGTAFKQNSRANIQMYHL